MEGDLRVVRMSIGWRLLSSMKYHSFITNQTYVIPEGFITDFASVPRIPLAFLLVGDHAHYPAVVHDYLLSHRIVHRTVADKIFLEAMKRTGEPWWRRTLMYAGVSLYTRWLAVKEVFNYG